MTQRVVVWFSCGVASAVAAKLAQQVYGQVSIVYCDLLASEHPDNRRFLLDIEHWLGCPITKIRSDKYATIDEVFMDTRYMAGINGARCTVEMKKIPRFKFQHPDDIHVFGLTEDEPKRIRQMVSNNPELNFAWLLQGQGVTKEDCKRTIIEAGIRLPTRYAQGYANNNCIGCVKATSARYWNMTRRDDPDVFARRSQQSRELGVRLVRVRGVRVYLDELPSDYLPSEPLEDVSCGPECAELSHDDTEIKAGA